MKDIYGGRRVIYFCSQRETEEEEEAGGVVEDAYCRLGELCGFLWPRALVFCSTLKAFKTYFLNQILTTSHRDRDVHDSV